MNLKYCPMWSLILLLCFVGISPAEELRIDKTKKYTDFQTFCFECPTDDTDALKRLAEEAPENVDYRIWLGNRYIQTYRFEEAVKTAEEAVAMKPDDWRGHAVLALAHIKNCCYPADRMWGIDPQKLELAKPPLEKAMQISPDAVFPQILNCYVTAVFDSPEVGLKNIEKHIISESEPVDAWLWKGRIYELQEEVDYAKIKDCYDRVRLLYPEAHLEWGIFLSDLVVGMSALRPKYDAYFIALCDTAIEYNEKLIGIDPDDYMPYYNIGKVYERSMNSERKAIDYLTKSLEKRETVVAYISRSQLFYKKADDIPKAEKDIVRGVEIATSKYFLCEDIINSIYENNGNTDLGILWINECIRQESDNGDMYFIRGYIHEMKEEFPQARENYRKAIELKAPNYLEPAQEYLENLPQH